MVDTTNGKMVSCDEMLRQQFQIVADDELQKLDFPGFCKNAASKTVERAKKLDEKHHEIKSLYSELGLRMAKFSAKTNEKRRNGNRVGNNKSHVVIENAADNKELPSLSMQEHEVYKSIPVADIISSSRSTTIVVKDKPFPNTITNSEGSNIGSPTSVNDSSASKISSTSSSIKPGDANEHGRSPLIWNDMEIDNSSEKINTDSNTMNSPASTNQKNESCSSTDLPATSTSINTAEKKPCGFQVGSIVYAKPYGSDIWFEAELEREIKSNEGKQVKCQVRFLGGQGLRRKIHFKNIASKDSVHSEQVELGTRIVADRPSDTVSSTILKKYKNVNRKNIVDLMFAGVVAELACEENRYRYLVFFDDGYAQYFDLEKLFLAVRPSYPVWNDVAEDNQDFIKEYLEGYPDRPLVCADINSAMQTEWDGEWWESKVVAVDASLMKLVYDIDNHSEWVYRGTTRLEPLHNHFMEPKPAKIKKKEEKYDHDEVYVEGKITHPQFGVCKYSLKDPHGVQQMIEWAVPSLELLKRPKLSPKLSPNLSPKLSPKLSITGPDTARNDTEKNLIMATETLQSDIENSQGEEDPELFSIMSSQEVFDVLGALQTEKNIPD